MNTERIKKESIIKDENQIEYYVHSILVYNDKDYAICLECQNPKNVFVFEYRYINDQLEIRKEDDDNEAQLVLIYGLLK